MLLLLVRTAFCVIYLDVNLRMKKVFYTICDAHASREWMSSFLKTQGRILPVVRIHCIKLHTVLYSLTVKKQAAKQNPHRFTATITGSTLHASRLHRELMFLQSRDAADSKCIETLTFQDSVSGYMTASFLTTVVCKWLCTSLFIPRLLP